MGELIDFEGDARADKVWKIAGWLRGHGFTVAQVERFSDSQWASAAAAVGKNIPSDKSRCLILGILKPAPSYPEESESQ